MLNQLNNNNQIKDKLINLIDDDNTTVDDLEIIIEYLKLYLKDKIF